MQWVLVYSHSSATIKSLFLLSETLWRIIIIIIITLPSQQSPRRLSDLHKNKSLSEVEPQFKFIFSCCKTLSCGPKILNVLAFVVVVQLLCMSDSLPCIMSDSLPPHGVQHVRLPCPSPSPGACSSSGPWSWWYHPAISSSVVPSPAFSLCQHQGLFQWVGFLHQVAEVLELQLQPQSFQWIFRVDLGLTGMI